MEAGQVDHGNFHRKTAIGFTVFSGKEWQHHSCCLKCGFFTCFFHMFLFSFKDKFHPKKSWIFFSMAFVYAIFLGADLVATTQNTQKFRFLQPPGIAWASFPCASSRCGAKPGVGREGGGSVTPWKINMEHVLMEVWKMIFLSKWVICRFHINLPGCNDSDDC